MQYAQKTRFAVKNHALSVKNFNLRTKIRFYDEKVRVYAQFAGCGRFRHALNFAPAPAPHHQKPKILSNMNIKKQDGNTICLPVLL
ncbi:hypothetical protein JOC95_001816 [Bacillus tianshenii]|uniref:Transposase n=1 Tax=Sutcliffiella tianshenii TaxID=1463404 RepID=A0ABS2NZ40_9BACI|nr:hypothetical protein [Bacillus tianshenii]